MHPFVLFLLFFLFGTSLADCRYKYIHNESEFIRFSNEINGGTNYYGYTVYLVADIDFTGLSSRFRSISNFRGTFDGQGYVIKNLVVSGSYAYTGLFGYSKGMTVRNTVIASSCSFTSSYSVSGAYPKTGGIIGQCEPNSGPCVLENNVNMANLRYTGSRCYNTYIGGIAGWFGVYNNVHEAKIESCVNYGTIQNSGSFSNAMMLGGIIGEIYENTYSDKDYIYNCLNYGIVKNDGSASNYLGGIISLDYGATIQNCFSSGKVTPAVAGIIYNARSYGVTVSHCYWTSGTGCGSYCASTSSITYKNSAKLTTINAGHASFLNNQASSNNWNKWAFSQSNIKITFVVHDGGGFTYSSNKMVLLPKPARRGYAFLFWCVDQNSTDECNTTYTYSTINSTTPITLYAQWAITNCSVTLNVNGGNSFPNDEGTINTVFRQEIGELPDPTRRGYTFTGWYNVAGEYVTNESIVDDMCNCSISVHWNPNNYTVTFDVNGGDELPENEDKNNTVTFNTTYGYLPTPTRTGYTFDGWVTEDNYLITNTTTVNIAYDHTLYAWWTANNYTVTLDVKRGNELENNILTITFDRTYGTIPSPTRDGFSFSGWFTRDNKQITEKTVVNITSTQTLYAHWSPKKYTVTLDVNGGDPLTEKEKIATVLADQAYEKLTIPTRRGYTFAGWYTADGGLITNNTETTAIITKDQTLYAHWNPNNYTVSFDVNGGDELSEDEDKNKTVTFNTAYDYLSTPTRTGYTFGGWANDNNEKITNNTTVIISNDHTIHAKWIINNYTLTIIFDDGTEPETRILDFNTTIDSNMNSTKVGYSFSGWDNYVKYMPDNNLTITALWTINNYSVTIDFGNGTVGNYRLDYNELIDFDFDNPSKMFYTFYGLCTKDRNECIPTVVPPNDISFAPLFDINVAAISGTAVGIAAFPFLVLLIIVFILILLMIKNGMKIGHEAADVEMTFINKESDEKDMRIVEQMEATTITEGIKNKIDKYNKNVERSMQINEVLDKLGIDSSGSKYGTTESFKVAGVVSAIASGINCGPNLAVVVSYLSCLFENVRDQEEFESFEKLYFGMKDVKGFIEKRDEEAISFGGIISGFMDKKKIIRLLSENEKDNLPRGVLFKVRDAKGYNVEGQGEILFELNSHFSIEKIEEVIQNRYIVVKLLYTYPSQSNEVVKI